MVVGALFLSGQGSEPTLALGLCSLHLTSAVLTPIRAFSSSAEVSIVIQSQSHRIISILIDLGPRAGEQNDKMHSYGCKGLGLYIVTEHCAF